MGTVEVRPLAAGADITRHNEGNPMGWVTEWWRSMAPDPEVPILWWGALVDGEPVGIAALARAPLATGGYAPGLVHVRSEARRRGIGTTLRAAVEDGARGHLPGVLYQHDDADPATAAAVGAWGLAVSATHVESALDLTALDRDHLEHLAARPGVELRPLPDLASMTDADWREVHVFAQERWREAPDAADGGGLLPFEFLREQVTDPTSLFLALDGGDPVGLSVVMPRTGEDTARNTLFTGVAPGARGRGVALALKARQALALADAGVTRLLTQNMAGNDAILAANRRLGFERHAGYRDVPVALPAP